MREFTDLVWTLNNENGEMVWNTADPGCEDDLYPLKPPNAVKSEVDTAWYSPAPDVNVSNDILLKSTISTLPLTKTPASLPIQTDNAVSEGMADIKNPRKSGRPFPPHNPHRDTFSEWKSCVSSGYKTNACVKYANIAVSPYDFIPFSDNDREAICITVLGRGDFSVQDARLFIGIEKRRKNT